MIFGTLWGFLGITFFRLIEFDNFYCRLQSGKTVLFELEYEL